MGLRETSLASDARQSVHISRLRGLREQVKVAAVCYRRGRKGIEFLLVQTRGSGRWTFPKGGIERGLTHAQAAALEAYEEAGVHGRMEDAAFAQYVRRESNKRDSRSEVVQAHLCEVLWLEAPEESGRTPTWFSRHAAKRHLRAGRSTGLGTEIARVVDRAVERIQSLCNPAPTSNDALQRVQFEALDQSAVYRRLLSGRLSEQIHPAGCEARPSASIELAVRARMSKVLQFAPPPALQQGSAVVEGDSTDLASAALTKSRSKKSGKIQG